MRKPESAVRIPCSNLTDFFYKWYDFLRPLHKLTDREIQIAACLTKHRYELGKVISDQALLDTIAMNEDTRRKVREECNVSLPFFQGILNKLRKCGVVIDNKINPRFIPKLEESSGEYMLTLHFTININSDNE